MSGGASKTPSEERKENGVNDQFLSPAADPRLIDRLAVVLLVARVLQTVTHAAVEQTDVVVAVRFSFFFVQTVCMIGMRILVALRA